jgi:hypothetical protein
MVKKVRNSNKIIVVVKTSWVIMAVKTNWVIMVGNLARVAACNSRVV